MSAREELTRLMTQHRTMEAQSGNRCAVCEALAEAARTAVRAADVEAEKFRCAWGDAMPKVEGMRCAWCGKTKEEHEGVWAGR
jgi:hypothetical protein